MAEDAEETNGEASSSDGHQALLQLLRSLNSEMPINRAGEVGPPAPLNRPEVEIELNTSRSVVVSGEKWAIEGVITNRGDLPVWIVDSHTTLTLSPELWGNSSRSGSIGAFFPTIRSRPTHEVVRIDPGASYSVIWKVDPLRSFDETSKSKNKIIQTIQSFAFVPPNEYRITACMHIWTTLPQFDNTGNVENLGSSFTKTNSRTVKLDSSPAILVLGAGIGGIVCFVLQLLIGVVPVGINTGETASQISIGLLTALLLTSVVTTLLSRLSNNNFIVNIQVKDLWGAIATGIVVQWAGYSTLINLIKPH